MIKLLANRLPLWTLVGASVWLAGCSGGSGQENEKLVNREDPDDTGGAIVYRGDNPAKTDDVLNFQQNLWQNLAGEDRCGSCHIEGGQSPQFVRRDDINLAYQAAIDIADLLSPAQSRMVIKVAEGHNCWVADSVVCGDIITRYISAWAGESGKVPAEFQRIDPEPKSVGSSRSFPASSDDFAATVYPVVREYCSSCHSEDSAQRQQPYFASSDVDVAYEVAKSRINLDDPGSSRFVVRLRSESHNCWSGNCMSDANQMEAAIAAFASRVPTSAVDPNLLVSHALVLAADGQPLDTGERVETDVIALYEFKSSNTETAFDTSGINPAMNLQLLGGVQRVGGRGIRIEAGSVAKSDTQSSTKLFNHLTATGEFSVETWVVPSNVTQDGPARIVTYSGGAETRNFTLGQTLYNYNFLTRNSESDANGMPMLSTPDADEVLQATLQHVVATYDLIDGRKIYVNGQLAASDQLTGTNINDWDRSFALVLGGESGASEGGWLGAIRFLAVHERALTEEQILTNYEAGVGEKLLMRFGIHEDPLDGAIPNAYIEFVVEQYDSYSYLFSEPTFYMASGADTLATTDIVIEGLRIGVNGKEASVGQAFANMSFTVTADNFDPNGVPLYTSPTGTIIELELGPEQDEFFLTFDRLMTRTYNRPADPTPAAPVPADIPDQAEIGLRNFAEINASISAMTTVPATTGSVESIYNAVRQQLPIEEDIRGFLAAHQSGVMQLSVAYCTALVNDTTRRASFFPGLNFAASHAVAFPDEAGRNRVVNPLVEAMLAHQIDVGGGTMESLATQPANGLSSELHTLISSMSSGDTPTTVIAACTAAMGSAAMLIQ